MCEKALNNLFLAIAIHLNARRTSNLVFYARENENRKGKRRYPSMAFRRHQTRIKMGDLNAHIGELTEKMRNKNAFIKLFYELKTSTHNAPVFYFKRQIGP